LGQEQRHVMPAKSSYRNVFFSHNHLLQLIEPVLFDVVLVSTAFCVVYFLSKKDPVEHTFFTNFSIVDEAAT
jgi:hypothetical protein